MSERIDDSTHEDYRWTDHEREVHYNNQALEVGPPADYPKFEQAQPQLPFDHAPMGAEPYPTILPGRADSPFNRLPPEMRASIAGGAAKAATWLIPVVGPWLGNRVIAPAAIAFYKEDTKTPELPPRK